MAEKKLEAIQMPANTRKDITIGGLTLPQLFYIGLPLWFVAGMLVLFFPLPPGFTPLALAVRIFVFGGAASFVQMWWGEAGGGKTLRLWLRHRRGAKDILGPGTVMNAVSYAGDDVFGIKCVDEYGFVEYTTGEIGLLLMVEAPVFDSMDVDSQNWFRQSFEHTLVLASTAGCNVSVSASVEADVGFAELDRQERRIPDLPTEGLRILQQGRVDFLREQTTEGSLRPVYLMLLAWEPEFGFGVKHPGVDPGSEGRRVLRDTTTEIAATLAASGARVAPASPPMVLDTLLREFDTEQWRYYSPPPDVAMELLLPVWAEPGPPKPPPAKGLTLGGHG